MCRRRLQRRRQNMKAATGRPENRRDSTAYSELNSLLARQLRAQVKGEWVVAGKLRRRTIHFAKKALRTYPSPELWVLLGDAYLNSRLRQGCYAKAHKMDPQNGEAAFELARIALHGGDIRRAEAMISQAIRHLPKGLEFMVMSLAADIYVEAGDPVRARRAERSAERYRRNLPKQPVCELDPEW